MTSLPILDNKDADAPSIFAPVALLREARRQKGMTAGNVPSLCILDPDGDIGLITTGAGLSMQLIDELVARGLSPFNFCDIRTGQFKGDPARLIQVMRWLAAGPNIHAVLINFFAGHTHLGEISRLLLQALDAVPELTAPITARSCEVASPRARLRRCVSPASLCA